MRFDPTCFLPCVLAASALTASACADGAASSDAADLATSTDADALADAAPDLDGAPEVDSAPDVAPPRPELVVMSYNVMCSFCTFDDHPDWDIDFDHRMAWVRDTLARHEPDLLGVQELADIDADHPGQVATVGGNDGTYGTVYYRHTPADEPVEWDYPDATIYYRASRFDLLDSGQFWLSPTPDVTFAHGWTSGLAFTRLVVWATLHDKVLDRDLTFATTHFDNNQPNQVNSAPLCLERFAPRAAAGPVIFVGDFNSEPTSDAYGILAHGVDGQGFHFDDAFGLAADAPRIDADDAVPPAWDEAQRIDHIWLAGATFAVSDWVVDLHTYGDAQQAASDHWAVAATVRIDP
ncbi:MAG: endonuclease/exonuclease/phosphatase family protein [Myxococcota bacterium]